MSQLKISSTQANKIWIIFLDIFHEGYLEIECINNDDMTKKERRLNL